MYALEVAVKVSKFEDPCLRPRNSRARQGRGLVIFHTLERGEDEATLIPTRNSEATLVDPFSFEDEVEGRFDHKIEDEARTRAGYFSCSRMRLGRGNLENPRP